MTTKKNGTELKALLKVLISNKVEEYSNGEGFRIKLSPLAFIEKHKHIKTEAVTGSVEDDLYYSATNFKGKK